MTVALAVDQTRIEGLVGASDAPAILGLDKWRPPIAVWRRLRGMPEDEAPAALREAAELGQILEPIVRGRYALKTNTRILVPRESVAMERDGARWLRCTPDGYVSSFTPIQDGDVEDVHDRTAGQRDAAGRRRAA